jgi:hypothetical protein
MQAQYAEAREWPPVGTHAAGARMARLYDEFKATVERVPACVLMEWWRRQAIARDSLPRSARVTHDRLVEQLGKGLESEKAYGAAMALYTANPHAGRERLVRLLVLHGKKDEAMALCRDIIAAPLHAEEAYAARQTLSQLGHKPWLQFFAGCGVRSKGSRKATRGTTHAHDDYHQVN